MWSLSTDGQEVVYLRKAPILYVLKYRYRVVITNKSAAGCIVNWHHCNCYNGCLLEYISLYH